MEEGVFLEWLKKDGDAVKEGEPLFTLESDKAAQEVESIDSGILHLTTAGPKAGDKVKVGNVLGYLLAADEAPPSHTEPAQDLVVSVSPGGSAHTQSFEPATPKADPPKARAEAFTPASPRARRAAKATDTDLATLKPTGSGGRIRERDVLAATQKRGEGMQWRDVPTTSIRRSIAERMEHTMRNVVPVTITCRCDASGMIKLRNQLKAAAVDNATSFNDIILKITAGALKAHPILTGRWNGKSIQLPEKMHIGFAVDTEEGLLVPVLQNVGNLRLSEITHQSRELIESARARRLKPEQMRDGCFTITNLGSFGVEAFTPIIHFPETAILGIGAIISEAVPLADGTIITLPQLTMSLTFDHRAIDGAPAARFLQTLRQRLESPSVWLLND
jgi:pyruvate dehydrogenase E2 component (dihydrolipoamide acetyltransferase)